MLLVHATHRLQTLPPPTHCDPRGKGTGAHTVWGHACMLGPCPWAMGAEDTIHRQPLLPERAGETSLATLVAQSRHILVHHTYCIPVVYTGIKLRNLLLKSL